MGNMHVSAMQAFLSFIRAFEWRSKLDNWGGGQYSYIHVLHY